jgi:glycosyltransferase involved in cell wall biosynthesis
MTSLTILILSHNFFPEVNAGANRFFEMGRRWAADGHNVVVVTSAPNHPAGILYPGYRNKLWSWEKVDGMDVLRVWTVIAPNRGFLRRVLKFISYFATATAAAPFLKRPDVVVSTIPHFFNGVAGYLVSRMRRAPWVLDVRDLWPASIVSVGAMKPGTIIQALQVLERFCYRRAAHIVSASDAFLSHFESSGAASSKISTVTNGVDFGLFSPAPDPSDFRKAHGLENKFVAMYVGTHGLAHQLDVVLAAADILRDRRDIAFVLAGDGAEREGLVRRWRAMGLSNVLMLPQQPRTQVPAMLAASDAALVTLRPDPLFELVIPSKIFEAMVMHKPILLGMRGKTQQIVEGCNCGLAFQPGDAAGLAAHVVTLADDPQLRRTLGDNGYRLAIASYDRTTLASRYLEILKDVAAAHQSRRSLL